MLLSIGDNGLVDVLTKLDRAKAAESVDPQNAALRHGVR